MAPLPENNTNRLFLDYEGPSGQHSLLFRANDTIDGPAMIDQISTVLPELLAVWNTQTNISGWRFGEAGSSVTLPLEGPTGTGSAGVAVGPADYPAFVAFVGRSVLGRRWRLTLYETQTLPDTDYRLPEAQMPATLAALHTALESVYFNPGTQFCAIDGAQVLFYSYVNTGYNAYQQRKRRRVA